MDKAAKIALMVLYITVALIVVAWVFYSFFAPSAAGDEPLMQCDGCDQTILLKEKDGIISEITLRYEWDD